MNASEPMTDTLKVARSTALSRGFAALMAALAVVLLALPAVVDMGVLRTVTEIAVYVSLATMWNLLGGYAGMVSIGQQAFIGGGGYLLFVLANQADVHPLLAWLLAVVICGAAAWPLSRVLFRLQGGHFAIGTWVVAEAVRLLASTSATLGGGSGMTLSAFSETDPVDRARMTYWLAVAVGFASVGGVYLLLRSRFGLALTAIRDSERAAATSGIDVTRTQTIVFVMAAVGFAAAGGAYFMSNLRVTPDAAFSIQWSALLIFIVVIGGLGTVEGPIVGALLYLLLREWLSDFGSWYLMGLGAVAIAATLLARRGLWGALTGRRHLECFPVQRRVAGLAAPPTRK
jgi:branched-chain amino acid transport system permease protein